MPKRGADEEVDQGPKTKRRHISEDEAVGGLINQFESLKNVLEPLVLNHRNDGPSQSTSQPIIDEARARLGPLILNLLPNFQTIAEAETWRLEKEGSGDGKDKLEKPTSERAAVKYNLNVPIPHTTSRWELADIENLSKPPIPRIVRADLEEAVFTHAGLGTGMNYERLEWLGDAYVEIIATNMVFRTFGTLTVGRCAQIREQLVRNTTLADYFRQYQLDRRARVPTDIGASSQNAHMPDKTNLMTKIHADMFEAYVAAVIISDPEEGLAKAIDWLGKLWGTTLYPQLRKASREGTILEAPELSTMRRPPMTGSTMQGEGGSGEDVLPKVRLQQVLGGKGIRIRYSDLPMGKKKDQNTHMTLYSIGVYLDGWGADNALLATGCGMSKSEAGQRAARAALESKKLLKPFVTRRREFLEAQQAASALGKELRGKEREGSPESSMLIPVDHKSGQES